MSLSSTDRDRCRCRCSVCMRRTAANCLNMPDHQFSLQSPCTAAGAAGERMVQLRSQERSVRWHAIADPFHDFSVCLPASAFLLLKLALIFASSASLSSKLSPLLSPYSQPPSPFDCSWISFSPGLSIGLLLLFSSESSSTFKHTQHAFCVRTCLC